DLLLLEEFIDDERVVPVARIDDVGRRHAVELAPREGLDAGTHLGLTTAPVEIGLPDLERRRVVLEGLGEVVDRRPGAALERATNAAARLGPAARRAGGSRLYGGRPGRLGPLARPASGVDDGEPVEPAAHLEPRRKGGRRRREHRREEQQRDYIDRP